DLNLDLLRRALGLRRLLGLEQAAEIDLRDALVIELVLEAVAGRGLVRPGRGQREQRDGAGGAKRRKSQAVAHGPATLQRHLLRRDAQGEELVGGEEIALRLHPLPAEEVVIEMLVADVRDDPLEAR